MAHRSSEYIQFVAEGELYDQLQQFIEDQNGGGGGDDNDDDNDDDDDDDDEDYNEEEEEEDSVEFIPVVESHRVSSAAGVPSTSSQVALINQDSENVVEENEYSERRTQAGETSSSNSEKVLSGEWNRSEIEGSYCPICMEAWTSGGDHKVCCLPCGHIYGMSCIKRWLQQRKSSGKCPQCNRKCTLKDVRVLYAPRIVVVDEELQKKVRYLEAKCVSLEKKGADWCKKEVEWQKREADLHLQVHQLTERTSYLEGLLENAQSRLSGSFTGSGGYHGQGILGSNLHLEFGRQGSPSSFILQKEFQVDGARYFDMDGSSQILIMAQRLAGMGGMHVLTKMSLIAPHKWETIHLPVGTKAVRDLRVCPYGRLALVASLGKKLSILSMESNNTILTYDLPTAAWSCSWDLNSSHYIYAGLQNGMLLEFDMRQPVRPVESMLGLTSNPIHTIHSLSPDLTLHSGVRTLLTASSSGLCQWNFSGTENRPFLVPESENQGVCISVAYCRSSNDIVASFRPKVEMLTDMAVSQPSLSPSISLMGQGGQGSHVLYKRVGNRCYQKLGSTCANVNDVRLPKKYAIIDRKNQSPLFVSGDEGTCELLLQDLPSLMVVQHLKLQKCPIRDMKYTDAFNSGLLSCLSEDSLQLFSAELL